MAVAAGDFSGAIARYNRCVELSREEGTKEGGLGPLSLKLSIAYLRRSSSTQASREDVHVAATNADIAVRLSPSAAAFRGQCRALFTLSGKLEPDHAIRAVTEAIAAADRGLELAPGDAELTSARAEAEQKLAALQRRPQPRCVACKQPSVHRCGRCGRATYCSQACQRKDWPDHKGRCSSPSRPVDAPSSGTRAATSAPVPFASAQTHGYYPASPVRSRLVTDASVAETCARFAVAAKSLVPNYAALRAEAAALKEPRLSYRAPTALLQLLYMDAVTGVSAVVGLGLSPDLQMITPCPIHCRDEAMSLLSHAVIFGDTDAVTVLLACGARVDWGRPEEGRTPFIDAAEYRRVDALKALLEAGADVCAATQDGETALHLLLKESSKKPKEGSGGIGKGVFKVCSQAEWRDRGAAILAALCAAQGFPLNALNAMGWSPMHLAADAGDAQAIRALIAAGAAVSHLGGPLAEPLKFAMRRGDGEAIRALLEAGARLPVPDTPRGYA